MRLIIHLLHAYTPIRLIVRWRWVIDRGGAASCSVCGLRQS